MPKMFFRKTSSFIEFSGLQDEQKITRKKLTPGRYSVQKKRRQNISKFDFFVLAKNIKSTIMITVTFFV